MKHAISTAHVAEPAPEDREIIKELYELGHQFVKATGAYMADHPAMFPKGTLSDLQSKEDKARWHGLQNSKSNVDHHTMTMEDMEAHVTYYDTHENCMWMESEELYLESLSVPFNAIADSIDVDVSNKAEINKKLQVCERYGFKPIAQLLQRKLGA